MMAEMWISVWLVATSLSLAWPPEQGHVTQFKMKINHYIRLSSNDQGDLWPCPSGKLSSGDSFLLSYSLILSRYREGGRNIITV